MRPFLLLALSALPICSRAQNTPPADCPNTAQALYARLSSVGLNAQRVYRIRGGSIDRPNLHLVFDNGTLGFTEDICGRITGAFFSGEGEVLLRLRTALSASRWHCSPEWPSSRSSSAPPISD